MDPDHHLEERQQRVLLALEGKRSELADYYRTTLMLLDGKLELPGARSRVAFIGHCMRELMNRVLDSFGRPATPRYSPSSSDQIMALPDLLARSPQLDLSGNADLVPVPRPIATAMNQLFTAAVHEKGRVRDDVAAFITDDGNANHAAVSRWMESRLFFVRWSHLGQQDLADVALPSDAELRSHVRVFEELLDGVVTAFFVNRRAIDDLLAEINALDEGPNV